MWIGCSLMPSLDVQKTAWIEKDLLSGFTLWPQFSFQTQVPNDSYFTETWCRSQKYSNLAWHFLRYPLPVISGIWNVSTLWLSFRGKKISVPCPHTDSRGFSLCVRKQVEFLANNLPSGTLVLPDYTWPWISNQLLEIEKNTRGLGYLPDTWVSLFWSKNKIKGMSKEVNSWQSNLTCNLESRSVYTHLHQTTHTDEMRAAHTPQIHQASAF